MQRRARKRRQTCLVGAAHMRRSTKQRKTRRPDLRRSELQAVLCLHWHCHNNSLSLTFCHSAQFQPHKVLKIRSQAGNKDTARCGRGSCGSERGWGLVPPCGCLSMRTDPYLLSTAHYATDITKLMLK